MNNLQFIVSWHNPALISKPLQYGPWKTQTRYGDDGWRSIIIYGKKAAEMMAQKLSVHWGKEKVGMEPFRDRVGNIYKRDRYRGYGRGFGNQSREETDY